MFEIGQIDVWVLLEMFIGVCVGIGWCGEWCYVNWCRKCKLFLKNNWRFWMLQCSIVRCLRLLLNVKLMQCLGLRFMLWIMVGCICFELEILSYLLVFLFCLNIMLILVDGFVNGKYDGWKCMRMLLCLKNFFRKLVQMFLRLVKLMFLLIYSFLI